MKLKKYCLRVKVTKIKLAQKQKEGIAEARSGRRSPGSVWGSGIAGTACAAAVFLTGTVSPWQVGPKIFRVFDSRVCFHREHMGY